MDLLLEHLATELAGRYRFNTEADDGAPLLGEGGMATVYRAEDIRHGRSVAIKVLKPELAAVIGAERFLHEIRTIATLQHPHILGLIDSGDVDGTAFYVMPLVEGESLRDRLVREKQLPVGDAIRIATETASALDYAHRHGIVHRDIKPENILLHDGQALVADFGIALAVSHAGGTRMTETGMSLGTPHYMSPEQAMGEREISARSDVYALGAVTYEMLLGEPPFTGPTAQAIVARVVTEQPRSLVTQRRSVPPHVEDAVFTALEKLPADRFASAQEFAAALANPASTSGRSTSTSRGAKAPRAWQRPGVIAVPMVALAALAVWGWLRPRPASLADVVRFELPVARHSTDDGLAFNVSDDGRMVLYQMPDRGDSTILAIRRLDRLEPIEIPGTTGVQTQVFSPDGSAVALVTAAGELRVVNLDGSVPPVTVTRNADWYEGLDWGEDGYLYYVDKRAQAIARVRASGGSGELIGEALTGDQPIGYRGQRHPVFVPGIGASGVVLFHVYRGPGLEGEIGVLDVATRQSRLIAKARTTIGVRRGRLLVVTSDGLLQALPFDPTTLEVGDTPVTLLAGIELANESLVQLALSPGGTLAVAHDTREASELVWVGLDGSETAVDGNLRRGFDGVAISPSGDRAAVAILERDGTGSVWMYDFSHRTFSPLATEGALTFRPSWAPDGRVVYSTDHGRSDGIRDLWIQPADGSEAAHSLIGSGSHAQEISWSAASPWVAYRTGYDDGRNFRDIRYFSATGDTTSQPIVATGADELNPAVSPDGHWLAYISNESGQDEVYVRPFPSGGGPVQVSVTGGTGPIWSHDGRSLFYVAADGWMTAVTVTRGSRFSFSNRRRLFSALPYQSTRNHPPYDLASDDQRFLMIRSPARRTVEVVTNWLGEVQGQLNESR